MDLHTVPLTVDAGRCHSRKTEEDGLITLEDDSDLIEALQRGDPRAADRLVERYGDRLYTLARRVGGTEEAAAEVAA